MSEVLVIDDHPIVLNGCQRILTDAGVSRVIGSNSFAEAFRIYRETKPDVVIVDLAIGSATLGGLTFIRRLRLHDRRTPVLVFTMHSDPVIVSQALALRVNGYVLKDAPEGEFVRAFQKVSNGLRYVSHELASSIAFLNAVDDPLRSLTLRELQTLELLAEGKPYADIAEQLGVSYKTVVNTIALLKSKLNTPSLPELMRMGIRHLPSADRKKDS